MFIGSFYIPFWIIGLILFILQWVGLYMGLYLLIWIVSAMQGNPRPKFFFWRGKKRKPRLPTDDFREVYHRLLDEGWTNEDIITLMKREYRSRKK